MSQEAENQGWHRNRELKRSANGQGYMPEVRDQSESILAEQGQGLGPSGIQGTSMANPSVASKGYYCF